MFVKVITILFVCLIPAPIILWVWFYVISAAWSSGKESIEKKRGPKIV